MRRLWLLLACTVACRSVELETTTDDSDPDGLTDALEIVNGTDPLDPNDG